MAVREAGILLNRKTISRLIPNEEQRSTASVSMRSLNVIVNELVAK